MFKFFKWLFGPEKSEQKQETNSTIEENPVVAAGPAACGCGRSPTGYCVGFHNLSDNEWAIHEKNPSRVVPQSETSKVAKKVAKKTEKKTTSKKGKKA